MAEVQWMGGKLRTAIEHDRREARWRKILEDAGRSGLPQTDYCRRKGIKPSNYFWWKREIARRDAGIPKPPRVRRAARQNEGPAGFSPVSLVPVRLVRTPRIMGLTEPSAIEVVLRGGRVLRIAPRFDEETLRRTVSVLEETC